MRSGTRAASASDDCSRADVRPIRARQVGPKPTSAGRRVNIQNRHELIVGCDQEGLAAEQPADDVPAVALPTVPLQSRCQPPLGRIGGQLFCVGMRRHPKPDVRDGSVPSAKVGPDRHRDATEALLPHQDYPASTCESSAPDASSEVGRERNFWRDNHRQLHRCGGGDIGRRAQLRSVAYCLLISRRPRRCGPLRHQPQPGKSRQRLPHRRAIRTCSRAMRS